jgi:glycerol-3-phosphate dehydrogenase (NAD(P)+)
MHPRPTKVGVIGAGAWGTALAAHCGRAGHDVVIWCREPEVAAGVNDPAVRENTTFLKGFKLPATVRATTDAADLAASAELVLVVVPTPFLGTTLAGFRPHLNAGHTIVSCTKGILNDTLETPDAIIKRVLAAPAADGAPAAASLPRLAFLSGPSFAAEVAQGVPTAVTIAASDEAVAEDVQARLSTPRFRCYRTTDVVGVELAGALKNVLAVGCGIADGLGTGHNGRAALITRGLGEMTRIACAAGGHPLTLAGLAGVGDLVLTCTGDLSRNRSVGLRVGRGERAAAVTAGMTAVAEGVLTSKAAAALAAKLGVDAPIVDGFYRVLHEGADPGAVVAEVMTRDLKHEVPADVMAAAAAGNGGGGGGA